ncbi:MAG: sugar phosphate isomerase/epimerase, partial [Acidobacteriaceae bacterium]|nr:sugar phosphate isomerase/epimerase [Acidobacteriaceae bacterium]
MYGKRPLAEVCRSIREIGYTGIEIAPFTLCESPLDLSADRRREYRDTMVSEGLTFVGLHWLMVSPKGLHVTTPDESLRQRSWEHIGDLIDLCADLGDNGVMV